MAEICETTSKQHFVLVHGASHGGWCWYKIRCLLESVGHRVSSPGLTRPTLIPSSLSSTTTNPSTIFWPAFPLAKSAGGLSVTETIYNFSEKIQVAVFVGATMLKNGIQTDQDRKDGVPDLSRYGEVCDFTYGLGRDSPPTSSILKKEVQRTILYQMSPLEDCTLAAMLLRPSPTRALRGAIFPEKKDSYKVPRIYIKTLHDNVLSQEQQNAMIKRWPPSDVYTVDSDHSPMFSNPFKLLGLLLKVTINFGHG